MRKEAPLPDGLQLHTLPDGRKLAYQVLGAEPGPSSLTAMYHHGTPSCYMEGLALEEEAKAAGIRLVAMDRCGIGASTRRSRSSLSSVAEDTVSLMDALNITLAIQIGNSGGGPYAAACAALYPDRTSALVLMAALASTSGPDRGLLRSLGMMDKTTFWLAKVPVGGLWAVNWGLKYMATNHAELLIKHAPEGLAKVDGELMQSDPRVKEMFAGVLTHAYRNGVRGMARDYRVLGTKWGVDLSKIRCRTVIWHGEEDISVPKEHGEWWARTIPNAKLTVVPGEGHITLMIRQAGPILEAAAAAARDEEASH